jgi:hypothetical protein
MSRLKPSNRLLVAGGGVCFEGRAGSDVRRGCRGDDGDGDGDGPIGCVYAWVAGM